VKQSGGGSFSGFLASCLKFQGLTEAGDPDGELYGTERLQEAMRQHAALDMTALVEAVLGDARQFAQGSPFEDDVCLAALNVVLRGAPVPALHADDAHGVEMEGRLASVEGRY